MELPDIDEENAALARTTGAQRQDDLPDIDVENARLQETDLPDIEEENARVQETDLPDIDVENGILAQKSQTTQTPAVQTTQPTATVEQQPTPAEQQPDTHWQEMDERARQFNLGDAIYAAGEHIVEGLKGARDVIGSVANPVLKLVGDAAQGLGNLSAHGVVMPNGIVIGERGELGGNKLTPDELAVKRKNNIGTAIGRAINEGVDTIFPNEPNDNPVTAKIQKVGNEIGGLLRFTIGSAAALGAAEYGPTWNADYDAYIKAGKTPAEAAAWADLGGITNAIFAMALKGIPVGHYVKKMFGWELPENLLKEAIDKAGTLGMKEVKAEMTKILAGQLFKNAVTEAGVLGGVSAAQTAATGAIQQLGTTGEIDAEALGEAALESGLHGAATGAILGALPIAVKIPEARKGAEEPIRTMQKMRAAANASRFTPEQKTTLNMRIPEFVGDDAEMTGRVMDRIREKMADEAVNGTPEGKTPLRERLDDPAEMEIEIQKATEELLFEDNAAEVAKSVNTKSLGTKAADRATEIATAMPRTADKTESRIAGEIAAADPDMDAERVWEVAEYFAAHGEAASPDGQPLTKERIAEVEKAMVDDKAGVVPVEQPDGTFKTVNEVEAEAAREERKSGLPETQTQNLETQTQTLETPAPALQMKPVDHSADWTPVSGKTGVFHTAEFPEVEIALQDAQPGEGTKPDGTPKKIMFIENLPDPATLDEAGQLKLGEYLSKRLKEATKLKVEEVNIGTPEQAAEYQKLVDKYEQKVTGDKFQVRADSVIGLLKKSGLASDVIATEEEFNAKLASYGKDGQRLIADGKTYGFTDGTNVYLNPAFFRTRIGLNTPIHEFGHLAIIATKNVNRAVYDRALKLIKDTGYWKEVNEHPDYAALPDLKKAEEALTRLIAERGERLEATTPKGVIAEIKKLLVEIWKSFGNALGIRDLTPEKIEKMTVEDIADAIRAEMMTGREFGTRELSLQEGDLKAKILRFAKYSKPTSKSAKAALEAAKKAWKELSEEQKVALGRYGDTSVLKTQEARTIANGVRMLREWDARRARISQAVKDQIRRSPNEGQKKIITGSPQYYVSQVTGDVTSPFAYAIDRGLPIPRKGDWGWDAWDRLTDGMKYPEKRELMRILGGEHPKRGGMDTVLSDYAQWLGISWDEGARDFEHGRGIEDFLDDILKERAKFEQWKSGDRKTREEYEAERASTDDLAKVYDAIANGEPPMGLRPQNKKDAAIAMSKMAELSRDGKLPESVEAFDTGANQKTYVKFTYGDGSEFKIYGDAKSITAWAEKVGLRRTASVQQQESGMTDAEFAEEDAWVRASEARRVEAERMGEQDDLSDMPDFSRAMIGGAETAITEGYPLSIREARDPNKVLPKLSGIVGRSAAQIGELKLTRITEESLDHLLDSPSSRYQKNSNSKAGKKLWRGTVAGMTVVDDIVATSSLGQQGLPKHLNREWKKKAKFYTADTRFAVELENGKYEVYPCKLIVSEINGERIVYDLTEIGEPTLTASGSLKNVPLAPGVNATAGTPGSTRTAVSANPTPRSVSNRSTNGKGDIMLSRGGLYTGSAADYEKPSLQKVGTGEGSQVYGWGLYASSERGVADGYANSERIKNANNNTNKIYAEVDKILRKKVKSQQQIDDIYEALDTTERWDDVKTNLIEGSFDEGSFDVFIKHEKEFKKIHDELVAHRNLYEQTFFTNRAPGDESHLLKWYEPVSDEQLGWIRRQAKKEGLDWKKIKGLYQGEEDKSARMLYRAIESVIAGGPNGNNWLGAAKAASEFLARAGIDGIKYPVDSYGKTVKDGDKAGWNYVSFRDDNIRVDHKWRDGEMLFSRGGGARLVGGRTRVAADQDHGERTPGGLAAARELADVRRSPVGTLGARRFLSLQISDLEELRKIVSEDVRPAHVARTEAGVARTEGQVARGKVAIWYDTIGVVDHTDAAVEMANLKAHGFFRNEDPYWCMGRSDVAIKAEKSRSEQQLSRQLEALGERRMRGMEPGGQTAERGVFADEVAKVVLAQERRVGGRLGRLQTIGKAVQDAVARMPGMNQANAEWSARRFLDWAYGQPDYSRNMSGKQLTAEMFGKWLVMPRAVEQTAPEWANAIEQTVAADPKLADAFRTLADRRLNGDEYLMRRIRKQMSRQTEEALAAIERERNLPIAAGSNWDTLKEIFVLGFHDKMGSVSLRINASVREKIKAMKEALRAAPPNMRPQLQQQIDLYLGDIGEKLKRIRISRQALERGNINEGSIYFRKFIALENEATQRWGLQLEDIKLYMDQWRVIETGGRSGSFGEDVVQARKALDEMEARLGPEKWLRMQQFGNEFFAIHERELLNDERAVQMLGRPYIDYLLTQVHYVATERVHSVEELDAIEVAKRDAIAAGVAGGDNVVDMMFDYGERNGFGKDLGEGGWTAKMTGSMAAKADVFGATLAKTASLQRAIWRNRLVIDIRDALLAAEVKGVRDLPRKDGQKFPDGMRYGHLNYMENGQKRTLVVPMQISSAFKRINIPMLNHLAKIPRFINSLWRSVLIDFNPAYWPMNIRRNQDSIEHNMPGMKENAVKTALRLAPGTGPIADLVSQAVVRNLPVSAKMLGKFENIMLPYIPQMERITKIIQDQNAWQREKWDAIDRNDLAKLQQLQDDWKMMEDMLRGNMFVSINGEYRGEPDMNAEADALAKKGLRTMIEEARLKSRPKSKKERLFDAVTLVFRANQRQQQKEDILAKGMAYLAERKRFGLIRKPKESALLVAERVSIAQGERKGYASDTMRLMVPFFNMIEKGVVRHVARYGIKGERKDVITQDAKFLFGSLTAGLLAKGLIQYWILDANDGNEEKALKSPYGPLYRYSKFYHDAYRNCSEYVRKNYQFVPLWTKGYTSIIMGGALTDEERILFPISDYTTDMLAAASGIAEKPSLGNAIMDASVRLVVPDLDITGPIVETLRIAHAAVTGANPEDSFRRSPMFDQRKIDMRYESWQDFAEFSSMIGAKLANYWGLRGIYKFDENGVDNGRGEVDEPVEFALKKIAIVSPVLGRMVKVQVGSPKKDAAPITAEKKRRDTVISVCAERLFEKRKGDTFFHDRDWKGYTEQLAKFKETYGLDDDDVDLIRAQYLNTCNTYENRDALDKRALEKAMKEAERQGKSKAAIWVMIGNR